MVALPLLCMLLWVPPHFSLDVASLRATHIIIGRPESSLKTGRVRVLDSWKGNLRAGDVLSIPALTPLGGRAARYVFDSATGKEEDHPARVSGTRCVLFLRGDPAHSNAWLPAAWFAAGNSAANRIPHLGSGRRGRQPSPSAAVTPPGTGDRNQEFPALSENATDSSASDAAKLFGYFFPAPVGSPHIPDEPDWRSSIVWIERGRAFAYVEQEPRHFSLLTTLDFSEQTLRERILQIVDAEEQLRQAFGLREPTARAAAFRKLLCSDLRWARELAFRELEKTGGPLPTLEEILHKDAPDSEQAEIIRGFTRIAGIRAGPELTKLVREELAAWQEWQKAMQRGQAGPPKAVPTPDALRLSVALNELGAIHYAACRRDVRALRDFVDAALAKGSPSAASPAAGQLQAIRWDCDQVLESLGPPIP